MGTHKLIHILAPGKVTNLQQKAAMSTIAHIYLEQYTSEIGLVQNYIELAWLPVSIELSIFPLAVFQNLIHLSAVPPPDATRLCWWGDHAIALTAAVCSVSRSTGCCDRWFHTRSWLSFPPDASSRSSCDHFSPQTWEDS